MRHGRNRLSTHLLAIFLPLILACCGPQPQPLVVPPADFTAALPAPPEYSGTTVPDLKHDDLNRMRLLGVCTIANNAKAAYIRQISQ